MGVRWRAVLLPWTLKVTTMVLANPAVQEMGSCGMAASIIDRSVIGDLQQPFHSADAADAGGNRMRIVAGGFRLGNLHHFWDTETVGRLGVPVEAADERRQPHRAAVALARVLDGGFGFALIRIARP
jgi:hypothetical protein